MKILNILKKPDRNEKAVKQLRSYCAKQNEDTRCRFDIGDESEEGCTCMLTHYIPEDWKNGEENKGAIQ